MTPHKQDNIDHQRTLSSREDEEAVLKRAFESMLLNKMGMAARPPKMAKPLHVPKVLQQLYKNNFATSSDENGAASFDDSKYYDKIQAFFAEESGNDTASATSSSTVYTFDLAFNLTTLRQGELIERVELAVFVRQPRIASQFASPDDEVDDGFEGGDESDSPLLGDPIGESSTSSAEPLFSELTAHRLIRDHSTQFARRRVACGAASSSSSGADGDQWQTMDIGHELNRWLATRNATHDQSDELFRIRLRIVTATRSGDGAAAERECDWWQSMRPTSGKSRPTLIVYTSSEQQRSAAASRRRRAPNGRRRKTTSNKHLHQQGGGRCSRRRLTVDFEAVGWHDWIFAPPSYEAFFCDGSCQYPLGPQHNATNHAVLQALVHSVNAAAVPKPQCVPTELGQISLLYADEYNKITIKNYYDMVVLGCGCR